jgi:metal-responsive CopG/Arc/MetJ family transcriptional regulator
MSKGRPAIGERAMTTIIPVRLPDDLVARIDRICEKRALAGVTRSQVIRELLAEAITSAEKRK